MNRNLSPKAVNMAVDRAVSEAVLGAVSWAVSRAVYGAVDRAVHGGVYWAMMWVGPFNHISHPHPHPNLDRLLTEIRRAQGCAA